MGSGVGLPRQQFPQPCGCEHVLSCSKHVPAPRIFLLPTHHSLSWKSFCHMRLPAFQCPKPRTAEQVSDEDLVSISSALHQQLLCTGTRLACGLSCDMIGLWHVACVTCGTWSCPCFAGMKEIGLQPSMRGAAARHSQRGRRTMDNMLEDSGMVGACAASSMEITTRASGAKGSGMGLACSRLVNALLTVAFWPGRMRQLLRHLQLPDSSLFADATCGLDGDPRNVSLHWEAWIDMPCR